MSSNADSQNGVDSAGANMILQDGEADALVGKGTKIYDSNLRRLLNIAYKIKKHTT